MRQPDLILLDMIMDPGMNGRRTYEEICTKKMMQIRQEKIGAHLIRNG